MITELKTVRDVWRKMPTERHARHFLENAICGDDRFCPHCGSLNSRPLSGASVRPGLYQCIERECRSQFTVTTGTPLHATKLDLRTWIAAMFRVLTSSKAISSVVMSRILGVNQKTAWKLGHAIREMIDDRQGIAGGLSGVVEVDEAFVGGKPKFRHGVKNKRGRGTGKPIALVAAGRNGHARAALIPNAQGRTMKPIIEGWIDPTSSLITDKNPSYEKIGASFDSHHTIQHNKRQYANTKNPGNTDEGCMGTASRPAPTSGATLSMGSVEWAMLLLLSVLWGGSFFFVGVAVRDLPTLTIVVFRVGLAAMVLWGVVALLGRHLPRNPHAWVAFLGMGVLNNVIPFGLIVWGQQTIGSGLASILNATTPLFTVAVAGLLLSDERMNGRKLMGIAAGFAGVVVMIGPGVLSGLGTDALAQLACLGGAMSYAFAGVFGRRFKRLAVDPIVVAAGQVTGSTLVLAPLALFIDRPWALSMPLASTWAAIAGLAVLSTALAYILYFKILERAGATNLLLVTFLIPVSAIALGVLVLGEHLSHSEVAGMALIGIGLLAIDGRVLNIGKRRSASAKNANGR